MFACVCACVCVCVRVRACACVCFLQACRSRSAVLVIPSLRCLAPDVRGRVFSRVLMNMMLMSMRP